MDKNDIRNRELIVKARQGDKDSLNDLFVFNDRFSGFIASKYINTGIELDDLIGMCRLAMLKAYRTFDLSVGVNFITYASKCMYNEINKYIRKDKVRAEKTISLEMEVYKNSEDNSATLYNVLPDTKVDILGDYIHREDIEELKKYTDNLNERDYIIINELWFNNKTQKEVAGILSLSQPQVSRIEKAILQKIKKQMAKGGSG